MPPLGLPGMTRGQCKAIPGEPEWPSKEKWYTLYLAVEGRLLQPNSPAQSCHDGRLCAGVRFADSNFHASNPISSMWQNYNNYSCAAEVGSTCTTEGYPVYAVEAEKDEDVKAAIDFARENNVRSNVKSTGHDFLGR